MYGATSDPNGRSPTPEMQEHHYLAQHQRSSFSCPPLLFNAPPQQYTFSQTQQYDPHHSYQQSTPTPCQPNSHQVYSPSPQYQSFQSSVPDRSSYLSQSSYSSQPHSFGNYQLGHRRLSLAQLQLEDQQRGSSYPEPNGGSLGISPGGYVQHYLESPNRTPHIPSTQFHIQNPPPQYTTTSSYSSTSIYHSHHQQAEQYPVDAAQEEEYYRETAEEDRLRAHRGSRTLTLPRLDSLDNSDSHFVPNTYLDHSQSSIYRPNEYEDSQTSPLVHLHPMAQHSTQPSSLRHFSSPMSERKPSRDQQMESMDQYHQHASSSGGGYASHRLAHQLARSQSASPHHISRCVSPHSISPPSISPHSVSPHQVSTFEHQQDSSAQDYSREPQVSSYLLQHSSTQHPASVEYYSSQRSVEEEEEENYQLHQSHSHQNSQPLYPSAHPRSDYHSHSQQSYGIVSAGGEGYYRNY